LRAFGVPVLVDLVGDVLRVEDAVSGTVYIEEAPAFGNESFVQRLHETLINSVHPVDRSTADPTPVIKVLASVFGQQVAQPDAMVPALTHSRQVAMVAAMAGAEERLARDLIADPSGYFTADVNPRSIAQHFSHYRKDIGPLQVLLLDQHVENFSRYLTAKKADTPSPAQLRRYIADKTLTATYERHELINETARRRVADLMALRSVLSAVAQMHGKATREFRELLNSGEVSLEDLPRQAVERAFDQMKPLLVDRVTSFSIGAQ
jgi:hypothetical protein